MWKLILAGLVGLALAALLVVWASGMGVFGRHEGPGEPTSAVRPGDTVAARAAALARAFREVGAADGKQILFGDLHVHTTVSFDAFLASLPISQGEGAHPQADACDFARFCSALDFWSINDHAMGMTPRHWRESAEAIRQCNLVGGAGAEPDTVAFLGWEWTQVGATAETHYGHKNVILAHTDDARIPPRPIAARGPTRLLLGLLPGPLARGLLALGGADRRYHDAAAYFAERAKLEECEPDAGSGSMTENCIVTAETPVELFDQLDAWGKEAIVIPHGTTWGYYTPPGSDWRKQLTRAMHDPDRQTLVEVYSGHGNSEEYRDWRAVGSDPAAGPACPEPTDLYTPTCWRAGEIVEARCLAEGTAPEECGERAATARHNAAEALGQAHLTVPGARPEEWLDAGQCTDCTQPAFNYRPAGAAQYMTALGHFDAGGGDPLRFRFGFIASSDNHFARPGTGYKEVHRRGMTESNRARRSTPGIFGGVAPDEPEAESRAFDRETSQLAGFQLFESERQASFFMTGGLVAAHASGRDRLSIWDALQRREVYGTSGPRILLWFDLINPPGSGGGVLPMGGEVAMEEAPIFQVRAVGSFEQQPGCPAWAGEALGADRLASVCKNECYHPGETRRPIARIDVVRIRPQRHADEPIAALIEDPWQSFPCEPDPAGCVLTFSDPEFGAADRDHVYYVRAHEAPAPGINADNLRCARDADGRCTSVDLCGGPEALEDDCLADHEPRAWSSPIFVDHFRPEWDEGES